MGFNLSNAKLLHYYQSTYKIDFSQVLTIGNQSYRVPLSWINRSLSRNPILARLKYVKSLREFIEILIGNEISIDSIDYSDYQKASIIHDLNVKITPGFNELYTFIYDGGSGEHIFDVKSFISNLKLMLKVDGYIYLSHPTNSNNGHGLYQFSPDFYYSVFCEENGFEIIDISYYNMFSNKSYNIPNPIDIKHRVTIPTLAPAYINVLVRKINNTKLLKVTQSDYKLIWNKKELASIQKSEDGLVTYILRWVYDNSPYFIKLRLRLIAYKRLFSYHSSNDVF
jgi:hypothetical protein